MNSSDAPRKSGFYRVLDSVLRPLVRAMITQGVTAPALYWHLKRLYVDVAQESFQLGAERPTDSRISVLTGVHRRDVKAFREEGVPDRPGGEKLTTMALVVGTWLARKDTTDTDGKPIALPRSGSSEPNFDSLVSGISRDVRPRTILDELIRQQIGYVDQDGLINLSENAFVGPEDLEQKLRFFGENIGDHVAAAVDNLLSETPPHLERAVFYNRLTGPSVDRLEELARREGQNALINVNKLANSLQSDDKQHDDGTQRFRFGIFFFREDEAPTEIAPGDREMGTET